MAENKLVDLSMDFAVDIYNLCKPLKGKTILVNQLLRSGTSIGANIHEANYAQSRPDFVSKLQIALKECYETEYWLILFVRTELIPQAVAQNYLNRCGTIRRLLIASVNTAKRNSHE